MMSLEHKGVILKTVLISLPYQFPFVKIQGVVLSFIIFPLTIQSS